MTTLNKELYDKIQAWKEENLKDVLPALAIGNAFDKTLKAANKAFWEKLTDKDIEDAITKAYEEEAKIIEEGGYPIMTGSFQKSMIRILQKLSKAPADLREGIFTEYCAECWNHALGTHRVPVIDNENNELLGILITNADRDDIEDVLTEISNGEHEDYVTTLLIDKLTKEGFVVKWEPLPDDDDKPIYI